MPRTHIKNDSTPETIAKNTHEAEESDDAQRSIWNAVQWSEE